MAGERRDFVAEENFEEWQKDTKAWVHRAGVHELQEATGPVRVKIRLSTAGDLRNQREEAKETQFTKKSRALVRKGMECLQTDHPGLPQRHVCELYSPPRIALEAKKQGLVAGTSFDLQTGWDLSNPTGRRAMWARLKQEKPWALIVCPPCTAFTPIQELNYYRMSVADGAFILYAGLEHLYLASRVIKRQLSQGRHVVFEQPAGARSWQEECIQEIERRPKIKKVTCDQCRLGLNVDGQGLNEKPTSWLTDIPEPCPRVRCDHSHFHQPLTNGRPKKAQVYPPELCQAIVLGLKKALRRENQANYLIHHNEGNDKVKTNLMTYWMANYVGNKKVSTSQLPKRKPLS